LYSSNTMKVIKSRNMMWAKYVTCVREKDECIQGSGGKARRKEVTRKT
jgi:hypothetical protein